MTVKQEGLNSALNPCGSGSSIIYAWAQNAPKLQLPKDVAFRVGGPDSGIDWLVLQVGPDGGKKKSTYVMLIN
jgi:peptidylglycine monooxygenase